jgi:hypothetical protein
MTAFNSSQLPGTVNTVEKLYAWTVMVLRAINPSAVALEGEDSVPRITYGVDGLQNQLISRVNLNLVNTWEGDPNPIYTRVAEVSTTAIPSKFTN